MAWYIADYMPVLSPRGKRRAMAWRCTTNRRLEVRHCGHPTANRPYWCVIDNIDRLDLGTHSLLLKAQAVAEKEGDRDG